MKIKGSKKHRSPRSTEPHFWKSEGKKISERMKKNWLDRKANKFNVFSYDLFEKKRLSVSHWHRINETGIKYELLFNTLITKSNSLHIFPNS